VTADDTVKSAAISLPGVPSLRSRLQRGITWNLVGTILGQAGTFSANIILARVLGRAIFGEFALIQNTLLTLAGVAQMATGYTASKYVAEYRVVDKPKTGRILGICTIVSLVTAALATVGLILFAPLLASYTLKAPHLAHALMISAGFVFLSVMIGFQLGALAGLENYESVAKSIAINGAGYLLLCSLAAHEWGMIGALVGMAAAALVQSVVLRFYLAEECSRQGITVQYRGLKQERIIFFKFALPAALSGFISMPTLWLANAALVRQPNGFSQMALYGVSSSLKSLVLFLPNVINGVSVSLINNQRGLGDGAGYRKVFWSNIALTVGATTIAAAGLTLLGPWLLEIFGPGFREGYPVLLVLLFSAIPETLATGVYQRIQSHERMWLSLLVIVIPRSITMIVTALLLSPIYGAVGLGLAYAAAQLFYCVSVSWLVWRMQRTDSSLKLI
jgi:O-antigen/teichoic acid export membrane protein